MQDREYGYTPRSVEDGRLCNDMDMVVAFLGPMHGGRPIHLVAIAEG